MTRKCFNHPKVDIDDSTQCWRCWRERYKDLECTDKVRQQEIAALKEKAEKAEARLKPIGEVIMKWEFRNKSLSHGQMCHDMFNTIKAVGEK